MWKLGAMPLGQALFAAEELPEQCAGTPYGAELEATSTELSLTDYKSSTPQPVCRFPGILLNNASGSVGLGKGLRLQFQQAPRQYHWTFKRARIVSNPVILEMGKLKPSR